MKKTLTINLNGIVFHIDDDAYQALKQYLADIKTHLSSGGDDAADIMADIEARIAELFSDMLQVRKREVVDMDMLQVVMTTMGNPGSFGDDEEETAAKPARTRRRFYRDVDNALLGGVAAGLAAFIGWDTLVVRLLLVILAFFGWGGLVLIYCLVWIIAPAAQTAAQKLEMHGKEATIDNIKDAVADARVADDAGNTVAKRAGRILHGTLKVLLMLGGVLFGCVALVVVGTLIVTLLAVVSGFGLAFVDLPSFGFIFADGTTWQAVVALIALILLAGIPLFTLIYGLIRYVRIKRAPSAAYGWSALAVWLLALLVFAGISIGQLAAHSDKWMMGWENGRMEILGENVTEVRSVEDFHAVKVHGVISLEITQDTNSLLTVSAPSAMQRQVETEVRNGVLHINCRGQQDRVKVALSAPELRRLEATGAARIQTVNTLKQNKLDLSLSGASKADLQLDLESALQCILTGASKLEMAGQAYSAEFDVSGASKLDADDLCVQDMRVECSGASKMSLWCESDLSISATGASKVVYKGNPHLSGRTVSGAAVVQMK